MGLVQVGHPEFPIRREFKEKHFGNVYNQYYWKVYRICQRYSPRPEDAKDLTHDVFVRYYLNFEKFRHESSPSTWMHRVAINLGIEKWRKDRIQYLDDNELKSIPDGYHDNETILLNRITVKKILARCPELTRKILSLFHVERMTQFEIGKMLGISRATVARHLIHLRQFRQL